MAPRRARYVVAQAEEAEEASSSEEEESEEEESEEEESEEEAGEEEGEEGDDEEKKERGGASTAAAAAGGQPPGGQPPGSLERATIAQRKISIKLGHADVCHVCGKPGHVAGFVGAKYVDCPSKPCYLCSKPGHSTMTCPFRLAPGHGCSPAAGISSDSLLSSLRKREQGGRVPPPQRPEQGQRWQVEAAVLKLHSRRVTCVEFHPTQDNLVLSGDKKGQIAVWDWRKVHERTVYSSINRWLTWQLRFLPGGGDSVASSSYDGTVKSVDIETGAATTVFNANPQGWAGESDKSWVTFMGMDVIRSAGASGAIVAGDNFGRLTFLDPRAQSPIARVQVHKASNGKVQSVHCNPVDGNLVMSAGNDYTARILDVRQLLAGASASDKGKAAVGSLAASSPATLAVLQHSKVINAASFSLVTGRKILTTSQDNRLRVWDYLYAADQPPDREIVHSHTFNRYLTAFRAEWDPKDPSERAVVVGRYISEDIGGLALHPVDIIDAGTGALVTQMCDSHLTTISPVNVPHPRLDVIVSGSSRCLYAWRPAPEDADEENAEGEGSDAQRPGGVGVGGGGGGGDGGGGGGRPFQLKGSATYISFDADPEKKGKKGKAAARPSAPLSPSPSAPPSGGKRGGKGSAAKGSAAAAAAAQEEEEGGGDEAGPSSRPHKRAGGGGASGSGGSKWRKPAPEPSDDDDDDDSNVYSP